MHQIIHLVYSGENLQASSCCTMKIILKNMVADLSLGLYKVEPIAIILHRLFHEIVH
jgi:hypothetical protein